MTSTTIKAPEYTYDDQTAIAAYMTRAGNAASVRIATRVMDDLNTVNQAIATKVDYVRDTLARVERRVAGNDSMNSCRACLTRSTC